MRQPLVSRLLRQLRAVWTDEKTGPYAIGLLLTLVLGALSVWQPLALRKADLAVYDLMLAARAQPPQSNAVVLVGVDEDSLAAFGQWPWPRYRLALLVEQLQRLGATVVALDVLMPEPDRSSPDVIAHERRRDLQGQALPTGPSTDSNSQRLAQAMQSMPIVIGSYLQFGPSQSIPNTPAPVPAGMVLSRNIQAPLSWPQPQGHIRSVAALTQAAAAEGFTNALQDVDGKLRRVPLLLPWPHSGDYQPSLALSALLLSSPGRQLHLEASPAEARLDWNGRQIPLDRSGNLMLDWRSQPPTYVSARAVLQGTVPPESLKNKIVLVGTWALGLGDLHLSPSGAAVHGLVFHATVIDNLLAGHFIARPAWASGAELLAVLLAGALSTWWLARAGVRGSVVLVLLGTAGVYAGAQALLVQQGLHLSPLLPMLTLVLTSLFLNLLKYGVAAHKLRLRTRDLMEAQDEIIISLSVLAEARDKETGRHILRTQCYVKVLARQLATMPGYRHLTVSDIELLAKSAPLHDIGKVGIPDSILKKPGKLTPEEFAVMQTHPLIGAQALERIMAGSARPEKQNFLDYARQMIEAHHERWDGTGYPHGLQGRAIPLAGRLMALADVYDALVSRRVYKEGFAHEQVRQMLIEQSGRQFDPDIVAAFVAQEDVFVRIAHELADPPEEAAALAA
ncbi:MULTISPECIES: CHASE2 domain-containing protein [Giesbergeria]|uniref:CHASE2 domain-containing protein n=1 Tax=Giesbergeria sinuosa TaxID=80883 RepID=A0ABV9Q8Z7_9BURK